MLDLFFGDHASWFTVPAVLSTVYFLLRLALTHAGSDFETDIDGPSGDLHSHDVTGEIQFVSMETISAFLMGAGWVGLACYRMLDMSISNSCIFAGLAGMGTWWLIITTSKLMLKLQSTGNIDLGATLGLTGEVCVQVPAGGVGRGRVKLVVQERLREFDAVQAGGAPLTSGTPVKVVEVDTAGNTVRIETIA
ncbi:MAG: hypothetical protein IPJ41_17695 [Phycisphaerales bacterium]|nr:hypothetical protein [Phycisphaerales bacterium]